MPESQQSSTERLLNALNKLEPYVDHRSDCPIRAGFGPDSDYCTCGVDDVVAEVDDAIQSLDTPTDNSDVSSSMTSTAEQRAREALEELQSTHEKTMAQNAVNAVNRAEEQIEGFLDGGDPNCIDIARETLKSHYDGAVGDASYNFEVAIEALDGIPTEDAPGLDEDRRLRDRSDEGLGGDQQ